MNELFLPGRVLRPVDYDVARSSDLDRSLRASLVAMKPLHDFEQQTGGLALRTVRRFVTSDERADRAALLFVDLLSSGDVTGFLGSLVL